MVKWHNIFVDILFGRLSIFDSGVLKSPTIIVLLSISFLKSSKIFLMYLGAPVLDAYIFTMFMSSWWILPLNINEVAFWVSFYGSFFWSLFCLIWVLLPWHFFPVLLPGILVPSPSLSVSVGLLCWVGSLGVSCFLIHSAILCLLIGAFNPFTFKVIIDR